MKLKDEYETDDMPEPFVTSCDLETEMELPEGFGLNLFKYLQKIGAGEIYTQVDASAPAIEAGDAQAPDVMYSRGLHVVNRTGVYAFAFNKLKEHECPGDCNCRDHKEE